MKDFIHLNWNALDEVLQNSESFIEKYVEDGRSYYSIDGHGTIRNPKVHLVTFSPHLKLLSLRGDLTNTACDTLIELIEAQMYGDNDYVFMFTDKRHDGCDKLCSECVSKGYWKQALKNNFRGLKEQSEEIVVQLFEYENKMVLCIRFR